MVKPYKDKAATLKISRSPRTSIDGRSLLCGCRIQEGSKVRDSSIQLQNCTATQAVAPVSVWNLRPRQLRNPTIQVKPTIEGSGSGSASANKTPQPSRLNEFTVAAKPKNSSATNSTTIRTRARVVPAEALSPTGTIHVRSRPESSIQVHPNLDKSTKSKVALSATFQLQTATPTAFSADGIIPPHPKLSSPKGLNQLWEAPVRPLTSAKAIASSTQSHCSEQDSTVAGLMLTRDPITFMLDDMEPEEEVNAGVGLIIPWPGIRDDHQWGTEVSCETPEQEVIGLEGFDAEFGEYEFRLESADSEESQAHGQCQLKPAFKVNQCDDSKGESTVACGHNLVLHHGPRQQDAIGGDIPVDVKMPDMRERHNPGLPVFRSMLPQPKGVCSVTAKWLDEHRDLALHAICIGRELYLYEGNCTLPSMVSSSYLGNDNDSQSGPESPSTSSKGFYGSNSRAEQRESLKRSAEKQSDSQSPETKRPRKQYPKYNADPQSSCLARNFETNSLKGPELERHADMYQQLSRTVILGAITDNVERAYSSGMTQSGSSNLLESETTGNGAYIRRKIGQASMDMTARGPRTHGPSQFSIKRVQTTVEFELERTYSWDTCPKECEMNEHQPPLVESFEIFQNLFSNGELNHFKTFPPSPVTDGLIETPEVNSKLWECLNLTGGLQGKNKCAHLENDNNPCKRATDVFNMLTLPAENDASSRPMLRDNLPSQLPNSNTLAKVGNSISGLQHAEREPVPNVEESLSVAVGQVEMEVLTKEDKTALSRNSDQETKLSNVRNISNSDPPSFLKARPSKDRLFSALRGDKVITELGNRGRGQIAQAATQHGVPEFEGSATDPVISSTYQSAKGAKGIPVFIDQASGIGTTLATPIIRAQDIQADLDANRTSSEFVARRNVIESTKGLRKVSRGGRIQKPLAGQQSCQPLSTPQELGSGLRGTRKTEKVYEKNNSKSRKSKIRESQELQSPMAPTMQERLEPEEAVNKPSDTRKSRPLSAAERAYKRKVAKYHMNSLKYTVH